MYTTSVDCLTNSSPHSKEANDFFNFFDGLKEKREFDFIKYGSTPFYRLGDNVRWYALNIELFLLQIVSCKH